MFGAMVFGWGLFNLVEGVIDHHVLHIHHVVERLGVSVWDWTFLAVGGVGLMTLGWAGRGTCDRRRRTRESRIGAGVNLAERGTRFMMNVFP